MFYPTIEGRDLRQLPSRSVNRGAVVVEKDSSGAGNTLIDSQNVMHTRHGACLDDFENFIWIVGDDAVESPIE